MAFNKNGASRCIEIPLFIFFAYPKKTNQKKGHFFVGIFRSGPKTVRQTLRRLWAAGYQGFARTILGKRGDTINIVPKRRVFIQNNPLYPL